MVDVGRAVGPLVGARQWRQTVLGAEIQRAGDAAAVQRRAELFEIRRDGVPVVERVLQRLDVRHRCGACEIAADDDESAIARAVAQGRKFHR
ncbi:MAG: hypothetical protein NVS9B10_16610 [Nevskia sp.]